MIIRILLDVNQANRYFMKWISLPVIVFIGLSWLTSCAQENNDTDNNLALTTKETAGTTSTSLESPCELITLDVVKSQIPIPDGVDVVLEDKKLTYPTCIFKWKDGIRKQSQTIGTTVVTYDVESTVLIVLVKDAKSTMFDRSTSVYKNPEELSGLGDRAVWGDNMNQLTFLAKGVMMHVHVHVDNDKSVNKKHAIAIAQHLLKGL